MEDKKVKELQEIIEGDIAKERVSPGSGKNYPFWGYASVNRVLKRAIEQTSCIWDGEEKVDLQDLRNSPLREETFGIVTTSCIWNNLIHRMGDYSALQNLGDVRKCFSAYALSTIMANYFGSLKNGESLDPLNKAAYIQAISKCEPRKVAELIHRCTNQLLEKYEEQIRGREKIGFTPPDMIRQVVKEELGEGFKNLLDIPKPILEEFDVDKEEKLREYKEKLIAILES